MSLVTAKEVSKAIHTDKYGFLGTFMGWILMKTLKISTLNKIYNRNKHLKELDFLDAILEEFQIKFEIPEEDLKRLPKDGAYITVSNHPLGGIDGVLLLKLMLERRADFKIIANFLLHRIEPLKPYIMPVNPFEDRKDVKSSIAGFKNAIMHLREGHPLGVFPAGEVSTYKDGKLVVDKPWEEAAIKLIKKAEVPVVPIYFHAKNSKLFYKLSRISDTFRTAKLPSNTLKTPPKPPKSIATPGSKETMIREVEVLRHEDFRLLESKNYEVFLTPANKIPNILYEIGRLREITFREVGEGTNEAIDLDAFDNYYHHMFLWDNTAQKIVGAYRMGMGNKIYEALGINGFYLQKLFRFEPELYKMMSQSIEMGRAFIIKEYQQRPMPLFLLWKGIVHCTQRFPEHKYLIGGVSISNKFSNFSKSLMIEFMKSHYYDPYIAQYIRPKKEFKVKLQDADKDFVFDASKSDLNKFDKIIDEVEPGSLRIPVLMKKYIKQNAKVVAFNVDPLFNNAVDGLMYIRISDLPEATVKPVLEEIQTELEQKYAKQFEI